MIWIATHAVAAAAAVALTWGFLDARHDAEIGDIRVAQADAQLAAVTEVYAKASANTNKTLKALNDARKRQATLQTANTRAERTAAGLRELLAQADVRIAAASREAVANYAATANAVFRRCVEEYRKLGSAAQGHADDVRTFEEGWPDN